MKHFDTNLLWLPEQSDIDLNKKIVRWNKRIEDKAERKIRDKKRIMKLNEIFS